MSVCLEHNTVLASSVGTTVSASETTTTIATSAPNEEQTLVPKSVAKIIVANNATVNSSTAVLQKVVNSPLITVLNPSGPLTVVKSICVTSGVTSSPQFTLVNTSPLTLTNSGKSITLVNAAPVTLVKALPNIATTIEQCSASRENTNNNNNVSVATSVAADKAVTAVHNVFVKNTCAPDLVPTSQDVVPQSHKILTANAFPQTVIPTVATVPSSKTINGQRQVTAPANKIKILSNVIMSSASPGPSNLLLQNKPNPQQRYAPRQKVIGNGATTKYLNKLPVNSAMKMTAMPPVKNFPNDKIQHRPNYPTHKSQIKTLPPMNNYLQKQPGIKTLPPQNKGIPGQIQRTGSGLRTIPPQKPPKMPARPNYIGKHAIQAQKVKSPQGRGMKHQGVKMPSSLYPVSNRFAAQSSPVTFTQALTQEIIDTLSSQDSGGVNCYAPSKRYEPPPVQYESREPVESKDASSPYQMDDKPQSSLNTLSLICHAVYLDHNYNATLPPDSPTRVSPPPSATPQLNGLPGSSLYSPGNSRTTIASGNTTSTLTSLSSSSLLPSNSSSGMVQEEDAASDISCGSHHKNDTEGEETDTAPEAEAVNNEDPFDHYGDYITRCICGFLHDDGYMIECDHCKVWQHVRCVIKNKQVPEEYLCEVCDPTKSVDRSKARLLQQQWMRDMQLAAEVKLRKEGKFKEHPKSKDVLSDTDSSDGEHMVVKGRLNPPGRRRNETNQRQNSVNAGRQRRDSAREVVNKRTAKKKERKIVKRKTKSQMKSPTDDDDAHDVTWPNNSQLPQLRQWIDHYEEAVTNHYSPELRARISSIRVNGARSDVAPPTDPPPGRCRVHLQPLTGLKSLVAAIRLPADAAVVELRGKYMLSTQHRNAGGGNPTTRQHAQRPGPFLFFYRLPRDNTEVCVDTRTYGNLARFVRRSCKPNAELRHCIEKGVLHLYVVTIAEVEKNVELTIKHESHDLAVAGTTHIACACGNAEECGVNKGATTGVKKNGEAPPEIPVHRKRRGRRAVSLSLDHQENVAKVKEIKESSPPPAAPPVEVKQEENVKEEPEEPPAPPPPPPPPEEKVKVEKEIKKEEIKLETKEESSVDAEEDVKVKEEERPVTPDPPPPPPPPVTTRRSSHKSDPDEKKEQKPQKDDKKTKKLSREERKIEAIMKAFERMEKLQQRRQEHQAKQAHRRESEPGPGKEDDKNETKIKRRRRKGRARTTSTNSQASRRNRLNSADSSYATSGDELLLSPNDNMSSKDMSSNSKDNNECSTPEKGSGMLLSMANGETPRSENSKSPTHDMDSNSNSAHSSPETPLSSACLLVAAAVGPLEPGFKFPKTKKGLMNEWLNKTDIQSASAISPSSLTPHLATSTDYESSAGYYTPSKNLAALAQAATFCDSPIESRGSAKKRWLRQAISEDQCDSPNSRPDSPPISEAVAPPKKRRLPRVSVSNDGSPPTTPTSSSAPASLRSASDVKESQEGRVEIVYSGTEGDSPTQTLESDAVLKERAAEMQQEFGGCVRVSEPKRAPNDDIVGVGCLMDPRLSRNRGGGGGGATLFSNSEHLVGTVEKTLSFLGFEDRKVEQTPAKRKLSITEYRQRKKLNNNDKAVDDGVNDEQDNNLSQSPKPSRQRSNSTSSATSFASSDDDMHVPEVTEKAPSAFNSEPTELERERENVNLRLKRAFGLSVDEDSRKPALNVETFLNWDIPPVVKPTLPLPSPTFPIPGSSEPIASRETTAQASEESEQRKVTVTSPPPPPTTTTTSKVSVEVEAAVESEIEGEKEEEDKSKPLYYTPDEEEDAGATVARAKETSEKFEEESASYVPPFNNPLYPNSNYTSYGSVIDDHAPYEGRNPSPPPELDVADSGSYPLS